MFLMQKWLFVLTPTFPKFTFFKEGLTCRVRKDILCYL
jgi:hypothetical protein